jgi:hypothetical protein
VIIQDDGREEDVKKVLLSDPEYHHLKIPSVLIS